MAELVSRYDDLPLGAIDASVVAVAAAGLSHGEIAAAAELAAKETILSGSEQVTTASLCAALRERRVNNVG